MTHHMFWAAAIVWAIGESLRPEAAKAGIPVLGPIPTLIQGPRTGLLTSVLGGGLGGLFGGGAQQPAAQ